MHKFFNFSVITCIGLTACDAIPTGAGLDRPVNEISEIVATYRTRGVNSIFDDATTCTTQTRIQFRDNAAYIASRSLGCGEMQSSTNFNIPAPTPINQSVSKVIECSLVESRSVCSDGSSFETELQASQSSRQSTVNEQLLLSTNSLTYQVSEQGTGQYTNLPDAIFEPNQTAIFSYTSNKRVEILFDSDTCIVSDFLSSSTNNSTTNSLTSEANFLNSISCSITFL